MTEVRLDEPAATNLSEMSFDESDRVLRELQEEADGLRERAEVDPREYVIENENVFALIVSEPDDEAVRVLRIGRVED